MKIAILTLPFHTNYGGVLQAIALQSSLLRLGHDVYVLDVYYWTNAKKSLIQVKASKLYHSLICFVNGQSKVKKKINNSICNLVKTKKYNSFNDIRETDFDAIVVGSDQIWKASYIPDIKNAFLDFAKGWDIHRIAYAASFGSDVWCYNPVQTAVCADLLRDFEFVSVREKSAVKLCHDYFGVEARFVADPTLLLSKEDYSKLLNVKIGSSNGTLLAYFLESNEMIENAIMSLSDDNNLSLVSVKPNLKSSNRILPSIREWLQCIIDADIVITDSFHASVFSVIFGKPFIVIAYEKRKARIESFLQTFGYDNHILSGNAPIQDMMDMFKRIKEIKPAISAANPHIQNSINYLRHISSL